MPNILRATEFSLHHFWFHLEPKSPLHMPAYNKGNVIRGGFGSTFRRRFEDRVRDRVRERENAWVETARSWFSGSVKSYEAKSNS
jgi:hypothetical protein